VTGTEGTLLVELPKISRTVHSHSQGTPRNQAHIRPVIQLDHVMSLRQTRARDRHAVIRRAETTECCCRGW
jgi:hypothetical protein